MQDKDPWQGMEREYAKESDLPLSGRILPTRSSFLFSKRKFNQGKQIEEKDTKKE